jgi:hypothetical protein
VWSKLDEAWWAEALCLWQKAARIYLRKQGALAAMENFHSHLISLLPPSPRCRGLPLWKRATWQAFTESPSCKVWFAMSVISQH